jgi:sialate O-acetylesterase
LLGFAIAGEDRRFFPAEVRYDSEESADGQRKPRERRNVLVLSSPFVSQPVHYRYAWARNPMGNIVNNRGVPMAPQRSDDWALEEVPEQVAIPEGMSKEAFSRYVANRLRNLLRLADMERRLLEAKLTVEQLTPLVEKAKSGGSR